VSALLERKSNETDSPHAVDADLYSKARTTSHRTLAVERLIKKRLLAPTANVWTGACGGHWSLQI